MRRGANHTSRLLAAVVVLLLGSIGRSADNVDERIKQATGQAARKERVAAIHSLAKVAGNPDAARAFAALERLVQDKDAEVRAEAIIAIALHALRNKQACPIAVVKALFDPDEGVRGNAYTYIDIPHEGFPPEALPLLLRALQHEDVGVRSNVAYALGRMIDQKKEVIEALERATKDKDRSVRNNAEVAIWKLTNNWDRYIGQMLRNMEALEPFDEVELKDKPPEVKRDRETRNLLAIGSMQRVADLGKENPQQLVPSLIKHLLDKSPGIRKCAARCLGAITIDNAKAKSVVKEFKVEQELNKLLQDADESVQAEARLAIGRISE